MGRRGLLGEGTGAFPTCWDGAGSGRYGGPGEKREISSRQMADLLILLMSGVREDAGIEGAESKNVLSRYQVLRE